MPEMIKRTQKQKSFIFSDRLLACFDKLKISSRAGVHIIAAIADSFGISTEYYILNYFSLHRSIEQYRAKLAQSKRNDFHVIFKKQNR